MHCAELSAMKAHIVATPLLLMAAACASAQGNVSDFAERVRRIVVAGDVPGFMSLPCDPAPCIDEEDVHFVIGTKDRSSFVRDFLANPGVKIKIFGPYTHSDEAGPKAYAVMFYDPELVTFNVEGNLSQEDRERLWWNGYVETVVTPVKSGWGFYRTPFYYGTEPPWMKDF